MEGFDAAAEILSHRFYSQIIKKKSSPSAAGAANNAFKELKTTFTASLKPSKNKPPPVTISQPTTITQSQSTEDDSNSRSIPRVAIATPSTTRSSRSMASSLETVSPLDSHDVDPNPYDDGTVYTPVSSVNRGMQRIKYPKILCLRVGNSFTLVIPPTDRKEPKEAVKH